MDASPQPLRSVKYKKRMNDEGGESRKCTKHYLQKLQDMFAYRQQWANSRCRGPDVLLKTSRCTRRFGKNKKMPASWLRRGAAAANLASS